MDSMHRGAAAIVGAAESSEVGILPGVSSIQLHADASLRAIEDAGLSLSDIDGVAAALPGSLEVADYLGIRPRWSDSTLVGGCSFMLHVRHAAAAIAAGAADAVLISHGQSGRSGVGAPPYPPDPSSAAGQFERPFGATVPPLAFTVPALGFLESRGMAQRDLAEVVVAQREWAVGNPRAFRQSPTDCESVLGGPSVAYPFTKDMCCVVTDGGGALVMVSSRRAKDLSSSARAVYLLGSGEATESAIVSQMDDPFSFGAFRRSSAEAFESSGVTPADVGHLMLYDAFAHVPLYMLEDLGFVGRGESGGFIADGHTRPGGSLPTNTNGGGLSYTHTGMYGMFAILESVRQLRGEAHRQVPDLSLSFVQGVGKMFAAAGSLVLSNRPA